MIVYLFALFIFLSVQSEMPSITKYVMPCAGWGTRMLPFTKSFPKEITQLMNKPAVHVVVEEGIRGGLSQFYMITKRQKSCIEDYFDAAPELEHLLANQGKSHLLRDIAATCAAAQFVYVRQPEQGGTGHAVAMLKNIIADDYFVIGWPDIIILGEDDILKTMIAIAQREHASVIAIQEVPMHQVNNYGVIVVNDEIEPGVFEVADLIEKPEPKRSPSNLINVGRFVLSKKIFASLDVIPRASNGELQLTDAIKHMLGQGERILAYRIKGTLYDIGRPVPWLEGTIRYGLQDPAFQKEVAALIRTIAKDLE